jgi:hypothetical protein
MSAELTRVSSRHVPALPEPPSPTSPSLRERMPHVFIFPPEEEQVIHPPWCCFNASEHSIPDYDEDDDDPSDQYIDVALDFIHEAEEVSNTTPAVQMPVVDDTQGEVVLPRKGEKRTSSVLSFINYRNDGECGVRELPEDIVEVVKVRRNEGKVDTSTAIINPAMKRTKTIKLPFQKALRSIKNVGRSSSSRKPHSKDIWSSSKSTPNVPTKGARAQQQEEIQPPPTVPPRVSSPLLTRQASRRLSQLFTRNNHSNVTLPLAVLSEPEPVPDLAPPPDRPPSLVISTAQSSSLPYLRNTDTSPSINDLVILATPSKANVPQADSSTSRSLSSSSKRSSQRFSVMDLHRLFTFSSIPGEDQNSITSLRLSHDTAPSLPSLLVSNDATSTTTSGTSSTASSYNAPHNFSPTLESNRNSNSRSKNHWGTSEVQHRWSGDDPAGVPSDIGGEMRLDSLHFDSLSFDPENFDLSLRMDEGRKS